MAWIVFLFYVVVFCWLITRLGFIKRSGLSNTILITLFVIKIIAGIGYFWFHSLPAYKYRSDTWKFYTRSIDETILLKKDPAAFFTGLFSSKYQTAGGLFSDHASYWNDVKDALMVKLLAMVNLVTGNNYYAAIIFFNFIFFMGLIAFYRLMKTIYPDKKYSLIAAIFLIPSFLFWCSGIHKDGLIFTAIAFVLYSFHFLLAGRQKILYSVVMLFCLLLIFFLRNYLVMVLLPSLFMGWMVQLFPRKKMLVLLVCLMAGTGFVFLAKYIHPSLNIPAYIADKQQQFKKLGGNSAVATPDLEPDFTGFATTLPAAIDLGFFRPHPNEKGAISLLASGEIILFWLIITVGIIYRKKNFRQPPVVWTSWLFALLCLIIIGYTVNYSGAVVRYRSLFLPLLLTPVLGCLLPLDNIIKKKM